MEEHLGTPNPKSGHPWPPTNLIKSLTIHPPQNLSVWVGLGTEAKGRERVLPEHVLGAQCFPYILHSNPNRLLFSLFYGGEN